MAETGSLSRTIDRWILLLLAAGVLLCWLWPGFRWMQARALWHLSVFGGRALNREPLPMKAFMPGLYPPGVWRDANVEDGRISRLAHHIDFQVSNTPFDLGRAQAMLKENAETVGEPRILALLACAQLRHFPSGGAKSPEVLNAAALLDWVCARGLEKDPGNGYFVYCQAAKSHLLKKFDEALKLIRTANGMPGFNSYLLDVNRSEAGLAIAQGDLPGSSPWQALDGAHPFNGMSQWLYDMTRSAAKKYNQERALDFALLHLNLGEKEWWDASAVRQASAAEQICLRAMGSMSKRASVSAEWTPIQTEFLDFLDDVGERQKRNDYWESFTRLQEVGVGPWLEKTRRAQEELQPAAMTLIVFLDGILILVLTGWLLLRWGSPDQQPFELEAGLWGFVVAVAPGAVYWTIWPGGLSGTYLFLTLAVSSVAWVCVLLTVAKSSKIEWINLVRSGFRGVLLGLLVIWLGAGVEHAVATERASVWLSKIGTVPWVEQRL